MDPRHPFAQDVLSRSVKEGSTLRVGPLGLDSFDEVYGIVQLRFRKSNYQV